MDATKQAVLRERERCRRAALSVTLDAKGSTASAQSVKAARGIVEQTAAAIAELIGIGAEEESAPIPMTLWCPSCGARHVERGEFATRPHHTHACQACGTTWRPAVVATVGVEFLPGFKDVAPEHVAQAREIPSRTKGVMEEIARERLRGEAKHGALSAASTTLPLIAPRAFQVPMPALDEVRTFCGQALEADEYSFEHVLLCEVAEFSDALRTRPIREAREELKQVAAVALAGVEAIDKRLERAK